MGGNESFEMCTQPAAHAVSFKLLWSVNSKTDVSIKSLSAHKSSIAIANEFICNFTLFWGLKYDIRKHYARVNLVTKVEVTWKHLGNIYN